MLTGLTLAALGLGAVSLRPTFGTFFVALLLTAAGKILFDPAMQAYLADRVGYARRGVAIAATELGWSLAFLVGMPLVGWLMARQGWAAPFPWLTAFTLGAVIWLAALLPADRGRDPGTPSVARHLQAVLRHRAAVAGLVLGVLVSTANESVSIVYGLWMEGTFGLQVAALGAASAVIGLAELGGEGLVAGFADRLGKRKSVALGIVLNSMAGLALPVVGTTTAGALAALSAVWAQFLPNHPFEYEFLDEMLDQFAIVGPPYHQCVAVSQTGDPTGTYFVYDFVMPNTKFNDYPKFGVWTDGYYMSYNQFAPGTLAWAGQGIAVFEYTERNALVWAIGQRIHLSHTQYRHRNGGRA